jgi:hypothetical protein
LNFSGEFVNADEVVGISVFTTCNGVAVEPGCVVINATGKCVNRESCEGDVEDSVPARGAIGVALACAADSKKRGGEGGVGGIEERRGEGGCRGVSTER